MKVKDIYERAAKQTGKSPAELEAMAIMTFASILLHAMEEPGRLSVTLAKIKNGRLDLEVNAVLGRKRHKIETDRPN